MTEHDAILQQSLSSWPTPGHDDHLSPPTAGLRETRDRHATSGSPESADSSRFASHLNSTWTTDTDATLAQRLSQDDISPKNGSRDRRGVQENGTREAKRTAHHHKTQKHKSGAFLLADPFESSAADEIRGRKQRSRRAADKSQDISSRRNRDHTSAMSATGLGLGLPQDLKRTGDDPEGQPPGTPPRSLGVERRQEDLLRASPAVPSPQSSHSSVDMDSTKIVSMALNLSESRRLVQRRVTSQPMPPRLAPLPADNSVAGTLRQQLQQQRRVSRTVSPRPDHVSGQRVVSNGKDNGSLQPPFERVSHEGSYRYNFSNSTMARAQKAKDYMELLAQYRRVIELLPPLKSNSLSKASTTDGAPLSMPMSLDSINTTGQIGRPYDPLQYIRNRKVRARERKAIDGQSQGFGDVNRVTDWVDDVAKWVATRQLRTPGSAALPPFSGADMFSMDNSPPTQISRPQMPLVKPKRPRNDWIIEPADLLADVYWLEQDDHKRLVEDRNWKRVFPQDSELYRPLSRATDDVSPGLVSNGSVRPQALEMESHLGDAKAQKIEPEHQPSSTRGKARLKLQGLRAFHRSAHDTKRNRSRSRVRRHSTSSSSSSDNEKRSGRESSVDNEKDILEKQMLEMMAREALEAGEDSMITTESLGMTPLKTRPSYIISPPDSVAVSRQHSRRESRIDTSDADDKKYASRPQMQSPQRPSRESLEVPHMRGRRMSIGSESSSPNSPEYRASRRDNYFMPGIGADLSPSPSRPGSPSRNPLSIVKQIFRDRSRERAAERQQEGTSSDKEATADAVLKPAPGSTSTADLILDKTGSGSRNNSSGPDARIVSRPIGESHKSHRKTNSMRLGETGAGLRSLFKAPRIDSVLKSGVSRVSDLIWKKESEAEESDSSTSLSDESDEEERGRRKDKKLLSPTSSIRGRPGDGQGQGKQEKHYLDIMPPFTSAPTHGGTHSRSGSAVGIPLSSPNSRRTTRFELLRPPRIDVSAAADSPAEPSNDTKADVHDPEARLGSIQETARNETGTPSLSIRPTGSRRVSAESVRSSRHFSITEKDLVPCERAHVSKREVARLRAMVLSSGVMAMEISRRVHQPATLNPSTSNDSNHVLAALGPRISWSEIAQLAPEDERAQLLSSAISQADLFPLTARVLGTAIHTSRQQWQDEAESFQRRTHAELLDGRIEALRARIQLDLSGMTRAAAEEADEVGGDLVDGQRRNVKAVVDVIDKLLRRRRRRFRWVRRAGWLALEWLLVGFMWYVWFVVMIARVFLGVGKGFIRGVRWLLWL